MPAIFFEDLVPGATTTFGPRTVTQEEIVRFASAYDPQPFHVDAEAARNTFAGRLIASGWHTTAAQMRMLCDAWLLGSSCLGAPGVEEVQWRLPVLPGDTLHVRQTVLDAKASRSRPGMGIVRFQFDTINGRDEVVMRQTNPIMFARRDGPSLDAPLQQVAASDPRAGEPPVAEPGPEALRPRLDGRANGACHFDDAEIGATDWLGEHVFTADDIVAFAAEFDPQPFHVDEAAAARGPFGRLAASGWQTAATWMRQLVRSRNAAAEAVRRAGSEPPRYGPSPGIRDLRWLRPVFAGDTIRYATTLTGKRLTASRPGWGLAFNHNTGWNQHGRKVFEFGGGGFLARADGSTPAS